MSQIEAKELLALNSLLTDRARLAIMATLAGAGDPIDFRSLLDQLDLSKGNLSSHMRKLEEAGLVRIHKEFIDRKPRTTYSITDKGKSELKTCLDTFESFLNSTENL